MFAYVTPAPYRHRRHGPGTGNSPPNGPLIAVIDDDAPTLELMDDLLHEMGWRAVCCTTARDASRIVGLTRPDVVILDLWMATRDAGWQLLDQLRGDPRTATVPVLICSADHMSLTAHAERLQASECGVLAKPFDLDDFFAAVRAALSVRYTHAAP